MNDFPMDNPQLNPSSVVDILAYLPWSDRFKFAFLNKRWSLFSQSNEFYRQMVALIVTQNHLYYPYQDASILASNTMDDIALQVKQHTTENNDTPNGGTILAWKDVFIDLYQRRNLWFDEEYRSSGQYHNETSTGKLLTSSNSSDDIQYIYEGAYKKPYNLSSLSIADEELSSIRIANNDEVVGNRSRNGRIHSTLLEEGYADEKYLRNIAENRSSVIAVITICSSS